MAYGKPSDKLQHLSAKNTYYQKQKLMAEGNVVIESNMGGIIANAAEFWRNQDPFVVHSSYDFDQGNFFGEVLFQTKDASSIKCAFAHFDFVNFSGNFKGEPSHPLEFIHPLKDRRQLKAYSDQSQMILQKDRQNNIYLDTLFSQGNVSFLFDDLKTYCQQFIYTKSFSHNLRKMIEVAYLFPLTVQGKCETSHAVGHYIDSSHIKILFDENIYIFEKPSGQAIYESVIPYSIPVSFKSELGTWKENLSKLTLEKKIFISSLYTGAHLNCDHLVDFMLHPESHKLEKVLSWGQMLFSYFNTITQTKSIMTCNGKAILDHLNNKTSFFAYKGQILYTDYFGEIRSDIAHIHYKESNPTEIEKIVLSGHVKLHQKCALDPKDTRPVEQLTLSDEAIYFPHSREIILTAENHNLVYYYNKIKDQYITAYTITLQKNPYSSETMANGQGNVHFYTKNKKCKDKFDENF